MLEVRGLRAGYGAIEVLHGIDLDVGEGECVALIGANGAGKTTTLKTICGLLSPKAGTISLRGREIGGLSGHAIVREGVTMCPEGRQVFPQMSVIQNLRMGAYAREDGEQGEDLERMMDMFPILRERGRQSAGTLSGGEQEMLAIARAL
ncbi:MAG: ATP-binding cassette domain-containing protein, partial [Pseudomonadota bacterium]